MIIAALSSQNQDTSTSFDKQYKLLFNIEGREEILKNVQLATQVNNRIDQLNNELSAFYKKVGKDEEFFQNKDIMSLDADTIGEFFKLDDERRELQLYSGYYARYFDILEKIHNKLLSGLSTEQAIKENKEEQQKIAGELVKYKANIIASKTLGEEIIKSKRENITSIKMDEVIKKVEKKLKEHPFFK